MGLLTGCLSSDCASTNFGCNDLDSETETATDSGDDSTEEESLDDTADSGDDTVTTPECDDSIDFNGECVYSRQACESLDPTAMYFMGTYDGGAPNDQGALANQALGDPTVKGFSCAGFPDYASDYKITTDGRLIYLDPEQRKLYEMTMDGLVLNTEGDTATWSYPELPEQNDTLLLDAPCGESFLMSPSGAQILFVCEQGAGGSALAKPDGLEFYELGQQKAYALLEDGSVIVSTGESDTVKLVDAEGNEQNIEFVGEFAGLIHDVRTVNDTVMLLVSDQSIGGRDAVFKLFSLAGTQASYVGQFDEMPPEIDFNNPYEWNINTARLDGNGLMWQFGTFSGLPVIGRSNTVESQPEGSAVVLYNQVFDIDLDADWQTLANPPVRIGGDAPTVFATGH